MNLINLIDIAISVVLFLLILYYIIITVMGLTGWGKTKIKVIKKTYSGNNLKIPNEEMSIRVPFRTHDNYYNRYVDMMARRNDMRRFIINNIDRMDTIGMVRLDDGEYQLRTDREVDGPRVRINNEGIFPEREENDFGLMYDTIGRVIGAQGHIFANDLIDGLENGGWMDTLELDGNVIGDSQNVHDSGVQASVKNSVANLYMVVKNKRKNTLTDVIREIQLSKVALPTKTNAIKALNHMWKENTKITNLVMTERDVIDLIWSRIMETDGEMRNNLIESFIHQAADIVKEEEDDFQCSSGRVNRIINSLNGIDDPSIVSIKPKWALKRELSDKASLYTNEFVKEIGKERNISENEVYDLLDYEERIKDYLVNRFVGDYAGVVKEDEIKKIVGEWDL